MKNEKNSLEWTEARLEDAIERMERGEVQVLSFLTPRERRMAQRTLERHGLQGNAWFWGGYPNADRVCLFLLPWHLVECLESAPEKADLETMLSLLQEEISETVAAVRITGSGYRNLTHRDFLGSVLGLGIERDTLGDLAVQSAREAVLLFSCHRKISHRSIRKGSERQGEVPSVHSGGILHRRKGVPALA